MGVTGEGPEDRESRAEPAGEGLVLQRLREQFSDALRDVRVSHHEITILLGVQDLLRVCRYLKDDADLAFDFLSSVTGVDRLRLPENSPRFEVVYHLYSIQFKRRVRLKVRVHEGEAVPSVIGVWESANWHEREIFDLFGVPFEGHPDLRRILMPDDWEGHPLRKDYPVEASPKWWEEEPA
jgi:NADH-quinone oxidoreductase subunit C